MSTSILDDVKRSLNQDPSYTAFDNEIIMHINGVLADLDQIGVGPPGGLHITSNTALWSDLYGVDATHDNIMTYVCLRVRLMFDPPESSYAINSFQAQIDKAEWRINMRREEYAWINPDDTAPVPEETVLDGGVG